MDRGAPRPDGGHPPGTETGDESPPVTDRLVALYRAYVGEPAAERDVYAGFGLFFAGAVLGGVALAVFLYSKTQSPGDGLYWQLREIALVAAVVGLPTVVGSVVVLLPVGRRTELVAGVGAVLCVAAAGLLVSFYPNDWTGGGVDGSVVTISVYATGLVLLLSATGTALVAQYLEKATAARAVEGEPDGAAPATGDDGGTDAGGGDAPTVTDEQVERDIESSLEDADLSWGGIEQDANTRRLDLNMPESELDDDQVDAIEEAEASTDRTGGDEVDDAVANLRRLQGTDAETARSSGTEEQVDALTQFREERSGDEELETGVDDGDGPLEGAREWLSDRL